MINYECYQIRQETDRDREREREKRKYFTVLNELGDSKLNGASFFRVGDETESVLEELLTPGRRSDDEDARIEKW